MDAWIKWSAAAYAAAWLCWCRGDAAAASGGFVSELVNQALSFAAAVIVAC